MDRPRTMCGAADGGPGSCDGLGELALPVPPVEAIQTAMPVAEVDAARSVRSIARRSRLRLRASCRGLVGLGLLATAGIFPTLSERTMNEWHRSGFLQPRVTIADEDE